MKRCSNIISIEKGITKEQSIDLVTTENIDEDKSNKIHFEHEEIEIENLPQQPFNLTDKVDFIVRSCSDKDDFMRLFEISNIGKNLEYLLIEFRFNDSLPKLEPADLAVMSGKYQKKSQVLLLVSEIEQVWTIYWKSEKYEDFLELKQPNKLNWEVLRQMLQFNENETYYTSYFRYPKQKYEAIQYVELKNLTKPYLSDEEYKRFIRGKNQKGVILFSEYCYEKSGKFSDDNVVHDFYKLDDHLKLNDDPAYVFESIANNLTKDEFNELIKSGIMFEELKNRKKVDLITVFLKFTDQKYNKSEQKDLLLNVFTKIVYVENINIRFLPLLNKIVDIYSAHEIYEIYDTYLFPIMIYKGGFYFKMLWMLFVKHTTINMQKMLLKKTRFCVIDLACFPIGFLYNPLMQDWEEDSFQSILKIYESYFNVTEMQEIHLSHSSDLLLTLIVSRADTSVYAKYMLKIFHGHEKYLKEFFLREVEPTNLNVFELFTDFEDSRGNLKVYLEMFDSLSKF
ncbi:unnamed protein product [Chironomus riparius]|uniref:Uncharacterized protein n=1 Tax=Chironomus riparius TaxID=315576 RepID=A0A9N9WZJ0_9DIPT|nr:unnamed protein product [Chironomus riparius]